MGDTRAVDICITRLRKKIEEDSSNPKHIITVYGFGYRFEVLRNEAKEEACFKLSSCYLVALVFVGLAVIRGLQKLSITTWNSS